MPSDADRATAMTHPSHSARFFERQQIFCIAVFNVVRVERSAYDQDPWIRQDLTKEVIA
jgi:hypothetical protein